MAGDIADGEQRARLRQLGQRGERRRRQVGVGEDSIGAGDRLACRGAPELLGERHLVELHVGEPGDQLALRVDERGVARGAPVEEHHGKIFDAGERDGLRHGIAGLVAAAQRHQRGLGTGGHRVAERVEDAAADILRKRAGIGRAGLVAPPHAPAPVDMGASYGEDAWLARRETASTMRVRA